MVRFPSQWRLVILYCPKICWFFLLCTSSSVLCACLQLTKNSELCTCPVMLKSKICQSQFWLQIFPLRKQITALKVCCKQIEKEFHSIGSVVFVSPFPIFTQTDSSLAISSWLTHKPFLFSPISWLISHSSFFNTTDTPNGPKNVKRRFYEKRNCYSSIRLLV